MLQITVPAIEMWDEANNVFVNAKEQTLQLEHSLLSLSKWESKWNKSFLSRTDKTEEEVMDYIRCMTLTQNVSPDVYSRLTEKNIAAIKAYIEAPMTATTFSKEENSKTGMGREVVTSELIYYWMVSLNIPFECQKWHLNRLITLVRVCNVMNTPPKKRSKGDLMRRNAALNAARKQRLNTRG